MALPKPGRRKEFLLKNAYYPVGIVLKGQDPKLTVRIIRRCNFRCPACSTFSNPERKGLLSLADLREIINLLVRENFRGVFNMSGGETTLHPELADMVFLASSHLKESKIVVFTNGDWIGSEDWSERLQDLLIGPNILIRFSLDRQHAEGKARALFGQFTEKIVEEVEKERLDKARDFMAACLKLGAIPGQNFDFAYKGNLSDAKKYMSSLGNVPIYPLKFQKNPARRHKRMGYMAVDVDPDGRARVYLTLGHIPRHEALGGIPALPLALKMNREALHANI
jgi:uncharacterized Fe-S cluster-containing radical SAM superfamily protein